MSEYPPMLDFNCPLCSGHGMLSDEALHEMAMMLSVRRFGSDAVSTELMNVRNMIMNILERKPEAAVEELPICPTPSKAKYGDRKHAEPNAAKYHQHPYQCECGYWHLSKQTPTEHATKVNSPAASPDEFETIDPLLE